MLPQQGMRCAILGSLGIYCRKSKDRLLALSVIATTLDVVDKMQNFTQAVDKCCRKHYHLLKNILVRG